MLDLETKLEDLTQIKKNYFNKLAKLNLFSVRDFLKHFPFRYENFSQIYKINQLQPNQEATILGKIVDIRTNRTRRKGMNLTEAMIEDETGTIQVIWFNQPYLESSFPIDSEIRLSGKVVYKNNELLFSAPEIEKANKNPTNTGRIISIYPETFGLTSKWIRWQIQLLFKKGLDLTEILPEKFLTELNLPNLEKAMKMIHFPQTRREAILAQKRFDFEDMFILQLITLIIRSNFSQQKAFPIKFNEKLIQDFVKKIPFPLTSAQRKTAFQILKDLEKNNPMNRLLNGDVGAGKTLVSAMATLQCLAENFQVAILVPTEVLAFQHFQTFLELFQDYNFEIGLLTSSYKIYGNHPALTKKTTRVKMLDLIKEKKINLVIGTHALIQEDVQFKNLALAVVDEQHRFGVAQRSAILQKNNLHSENKIPHLLTMTATPIPRTLALAIFGDLDISILDEKPLNRKEIKTQLVFPEKQNQIYQLIKNEIKSGRQAFVIFPLVEESEMLQKVKAVITEHQRLQKEVFPEFSVGLIHGKLKSKEKEEIMLKFKNQEINILVSTSVIEVGVDIPNATIMIIENAERFGLSQLHQFRGRIGRGEFQSYCFLFSENRNSERLKAMEQFSDGFKLADIDFKLRGPGEIMGSRQSGLPEGVMKNITNLKLVVLAKEKAKEILEQDPELKNYPELKKIVSKFGTEVHFE
jgi:ATP-dependent DNA helicase RecG